MVKIEVRYYNINENKIGTWLADSIKFDMEGGFVMTLNDREFKFTQGYVNILEIGMIQL